MEYKNRCCATCEWSISPQEEEDILTDNPESETRAGDCCLNMNHNGNFLCNSYSYKSTMIEDNIEEILSSNRHQFIFAYDGDARNEVVDAIEQRKNTIIKIDNLKIDNPRKKVKDVIKLKFITREYLNFKIAYNLLEKNKINLSSEQSSQLIEAINKLFLNKESEKIKDYETLLIILKKSIDFYKNNYNKLINEENTESINNLKIQFIDIITLINHIKKIIKDNSYIFILFNNKNYPIILQQVIMNFVTSRCNKDLSTKIFTEFNKWKTNYDEVGNLAQNIHDYDVVELDDNFEKQLKYKNN